MSMTNFSSERIVKDLFTTEDISEDRPTAWYVALHTGDPGAGSGSNEADDADYARQSVEFTAQEDGNTWHVANDDALTFPAADLPFTVYYITVFDAETDGNMLARFQLPNSRLVAEGDSFVIPAGELIISGA